MTSDPRFPFAAGDPAEPDDILAGAAADAADAGPAPGPEGARLADVIAARRDGLDPNADAARRREDRRRALAAEARIRARRRLSLVAVAFAIGYVAVAGRMALLAASDPAEPRALAAAERFSAERAEIVDRRGALLASNLPVWSVYARPQEMLDPAGTAAALARIFPDLDAAALERRFTDGRRFLWIKRAISPVERVAVHDIGDPGLAFGPRETRLYPAGRTAAHILGGAAFGKEGVRAAELIGVAGVERQLDARLRDPALAAEPLRLSIDMRVQAAFADVLRDSVARFHAKGAAGVLMDANTGEIISMVSLPDFDPNDRPPPPTRGRPADHPTFNRAAQGVYELGSTFKVFTAAMMLDAGLVRPDTMINTEGPLHWGRFRIRDFHRMPPQMSLRDVIVESSNVGTARLAVLGGATRQKAFLDKLGLLAASPIELPEARQAQPLLPERWSEISTMTISYGHGLAATPLHLAAAYASVLNGGLRVTPTLLADGPAPTEADRVISEKTSMQLREMMRAVVTEGTGKNAEVPGYFLGGKTGTADKPNDRGGYDRSAVMATFAGVFPAHDPAYVIVVTLDEAEDRKEGRRTFRTAGWTAAPTVKAALTRIAPILGMRPQPAPPPSEASSPGRLASR